MQCPSCGFGAGDLQRPAIADALERLKSGEATVLVAAKLDRLSRSVLDFAKLLERSEKEGWGLVLLDLDLDTTTPAGRLTLTDPLRRSPLTLQLGASGVGLVSASIGATTEVQFDASGTPYDADGTLLSADGTIGVSGGRTVRVTRNTGLITID